MINKKLIFYYNKISSFSLFQPPWHPRRDVWSHNGPLGHLWVARMGGPGWTSGNAVSPPLSVLLSHVRSQVQHQSRPDQVRPLARHPNPKSPRGSVPWCPVCNPATRLLEVHAPCHALHVACASIRRHILRRVPAETARHWKSNRSSPATAAWSSRIPGEAAAPAREPEWGLSLSQLVCASTWWVFLCQLLKKFNAYTILTHTSYMYK